MANGKSLLLGFIFGGVVSGAATLLSTPTSGRDLRNQAVSRGEDLVHSFERLKDEGFHLSDQIAQTSKEGISLIKELSTDMKQSIESWKRTIEPHQKNIQKYLTQIEESLRELEEKNSRKEN
ncbi:YtxH domain-containing protein [Aquibacillus halophilus]|uniref:YtxH domain-containing protein n=1 Tax=Aquibacillus halophilus TaxID=930132 RepID=A0A6A8DSC8_9BACI|nr:YtxH domain-containing protein [Aquibacillus halophilus]MRH44132.1 YtxH domain-containing protein [Aquibacillus halophilus]